MFERYDLDIASSLVIYKDFKEFLNLIISNSMAIYNSILEEIIEKEQQKNIKKPIVIRGFCDMQVS